jgi:DNA-directed RNA polymerase subunit M/transcription elongation factor TFIIS
LGEKKMTTADKVLRKCLGDKSKNSADDVKCEYCGFVFNEIKNRKNQGHQEYIVKCPKCKNTWQVGPALY